MRSPPLSSAYSTVPSMAAVERVIPFEKLSKADLYLDAVYLGGSSNNVKDDPLGPLLPGVGNQGGFRYVGSPWKGTVQLSVLYTSGAETDWPDVLDSQTGILTYYGDNRSPGHALLDTQRGGNRLLEFAFDAARGPSREDRLHVPPFLLFEKAAPGRAVRFRGLLAPGSSRLNPDEELVAIWRSKNGLRFQNYRAKFTVLDVSTVPRTWLTAISNGAATTSNGCPSRGANGWMAGSTKPSSHHRPWSCGRKSNNCRKTKPVCPCTRRSMTTFTASQQTSSHVPSKYGG